MNCRPLAYTQAATITERWPGGYGSSPGIAVFQSPGENSSSSRLVTIGEAIISPAGHASGCDNGLLATAERISAQLQNIRVT